MRLRPSPAALRRLAVSAAMASTVLASLAAVTPPTQAEAPEAPARSLYLVTLDGPGSAGGGPGPQLLAEQDTALAAVGAARPVYRWTSALNGFAVRLTVAQARELVGVPGVALVEHNSLRKLAGTPANTATVTTGTRTEGGGGAGVVIGVIDSGLDPDSAVFAGVPGLGRPAQGFTGTCETGPGWDEQGCSRKVVGASWFVQGYGEDRLSNSSWLSARDDSGHGTLVASVAAGNSEVSVRVGNQRLGTYSGQAPQARLAVYKACWTAPDPDHDGCSTADLVTAIDRATADGVDVVNLSVAGGQLFDTVDRALLGATEGGAVVVAAAGNSGHGGYAAHPSPWVTTVGALSGLTAPGRLQLGRGASLIGATAARRPVTGRLVEGTAIAAAGASAEDARLCKPGSLDAAKAAGRIVICDRGVIGRIDKSRAVQLADGAAMVLVDPTGRDVHADFHSVPTLHIPAAAGRQLRAWLRTHRWAEVTLAPGDGGARPSAPASWSAAGDPDGDLVKPDLTARGVDVLGAAARTPASAARWGSFTGTSAAAAAVSGRAATVVGRHPDWTPAMVRSALATSAVPVKGDPSALVQGAGRARAKTAVRPGLVYRVRPSDYRRYLTGELDGLDLNLPAIKAQGPVVVQRTITSVGRKPMYYSVKARGFDEHRVRVTPVAVRIRPGESRTFTVTITGPTSRTADSGWLTWRGADHTHARIPVVISD